MGETSSRAGRHAAPVAGSPLRRWAAMLLAAMVVLVSFSRADDASAADSGSVTLAPTQATFTSSASPRTSYAAYDLLVSTSSVYRTYLTFDTSAVPAGATVTNAELRLSVRTSATRTPGLAVRSVPSGWRASAVTSANRPAARGAALNTPVTAVPGATMSARLDPSGIVAGGATSFEVLYEVRASGVRLDKLGSKGPRLVLTWTTGGSTATPVPTPTRTSATPRPSASATPRPSSTPRPTTTPTVRPTPTASAAPSPTAAPVTPPQSTRLPYEVAGTGQAKVFAHYFTPYPISLDNDDPSRDYYARNYLAPDGEGGAHREYGGLLRDRPVERSPLSGDWKMKDARTEIDQAADAGIDGFIVDLLNLENFHWERAVRMADAAHADGRGFVVIPQLDMTTSAGKADIDLITAKFAEYVAKPAAYRLPDGRPVISAFKAEAKSADWWREVLTKLRTDHGVDAAFMPTFLNAVDNMEAFAPITYAQGVWGTRNPGNILAGRNFAAQAHALGDQWLAPISVQDSRPMQGVFQEAANLETLRASWQRAIEDGADMVQLVAWNDYSENTVFAPSVHHGNVFLDVSGYYGTQFKQGRAPAVTGDAVYLTHRMQPVDAKPQLSHDLMELMSGGTTSTKPRDTVEVQTFLTAPAAVTVRIGSATHTYTAPAGVDARTFPLALGSVSASATRSGATIARVTSPFTVVSSPLVQDLQYVAASSRG
ncbi:DNRLRE domain-containing protein [Cellulomonas sp. zg-ZUI199]|uniref:DNRLRE domain-containing protein n=1 Tax=Cellulomonas wangleii TaxID=2816956 RepID=A0ABX8D8M7_9CELL|nr:endo-1,3-alpha-glucanase family glycosylhydrolase [Cellulomonas wangleii]MBO0926691.1 DNRLRE domain-containing protein [Cellulomonas wangleii]QVI63190.1 DNRLRE domain-containing protein [Cellulomonas wangleii]